MIKIALIDDNQLDNEKLKGFLVKYASDMHLSFDYSVFSSADVFLKESSTAFDLIFIDIDMPGMTGLEAAKAVRKTNQTVSIVFVTNLFQFAVKGYEVNALDYILKPVEYDSFALKMNRIIKIVSMSESKKIAVYYKGENRVLDVRQIVYIEVRGHYLTFYLDDLSSFVVRGKISAFEKELSMSGFCLCNSYYLVNLRFVSGIRKHNVIVLKKELPMSRAKQNRFMSELAKYIGGLE